MELLAQILNDRVILTVTGFVMSSLLATVAGLIVYIWGERKKQLELDRRLQVEFNERLKLEMRQLENNQKEFEKTIVRLEETVRNLSKWLKKTDERYEALFRTVMRLDDEMDQVKKAG